MDKKIKPVTTLALNKMLIAIALLALTAGIFIGKLTTDASKDLTDNIPQLPIIGDVNKIISIHDFGPKDVEQSNISLEDVIHMAEPFTIDYDILLVGEDGLIAQIKKDNLDDCSLRFSDENGWESITEKHPINSRIKKIKEIVVVAKDNSWDYGLNIINRTENILNITPGQLYLKEPILYPYFDGKSTKTQGERKYDVMLYKQKRLIPIKRLVGLEHESLLMMGSNGIYELIDNKGYLELAGNKINYIDLKKREQIEDIKGIITETPPDSIMDTYYDALYYIENDEDVLIIFLDGFGYHQYEYALSQGFIPFMEGLGRGKMALSVYKPVTNAGFAAMITGQPPNINGVYDRKYKDLKTESIFGAAKKMNKKSILIGGSIKVLNTEIQPVLNIDKNKNGTTDDEIFEAALAGLKERPNLALVHLHSIDDTGHEYGELADETLERIKTIDSYVRELSIKWEGKVIITSDHGMHSTSGGGDHGTFRYEDMVVPYFLFEGEGKK